MDTLVCALNVPEVYNVRDLGGLRTKDGNVCVIRLWLPTDPSGMVSQARTGKPQR